MTEGNFNSKLAQVVQQYGLTLLYSEQYDKVMKIFTDKGPFALKKVPASTGITFVNNLRTLYEKGYNRIVPIYPTIDGRFGVLFEQSLYYLMPWVMNEGRSDKLKYEQLFRELARIHSLTIRETTISIEERTEYYEETIALWESTSQFINEYLEHCEGKWYMSPFELIFCLYYYDISEALKFAIKNFKEWYELTKEHIKVRTVMNHGNFAEDHFLLDARGYGYFINFEKSSNSAPATDLLTFISNYSKRYLRHDDDILHWLSIYFKYVPLKKEEIKLFLSYLSYPGKIIATVNDYYLHGKEQSEIKAVEALQNDYWHLKNIEYVAMKLQEQEEQKQEAEQAAQNQ